MDTNYMLKVALDFYKGTLFVWRIIRGFSFFFLNMQSHAHAQVQSATQA